MANKEFTADLIAPCGINCGLCKAYLAYSREVPYKKGEVYHCTGCRVRDKKCAFIKRDCEKLRKKQISYCFECQDMPCERLSKLDRLYTSHYGISPIENQKLIKEKGMDEFLKTEKEKHKCPSCGDVVSMHNGKCYACGFQAQKPKPTTPKVRWVPNQKTKKQQK